MGLSVVPSFQYGIAIDMWITVANARCNVIRIDERYIEPSNVSLLKYDEVAPRGFKHALRLKWIDDFGKDGSKKNLDVEYIAFRACRN